MSELSEELEAETRGIGCKLCQFLAGLPAETRDDWERQLARPITIIGQEAVVRALAKRGLILTKSSFRRHRGNHHGT